MHNDGYDLLYTLLLVHVLEIDNRLNSAITYESP